MTTSPLTLDTVERVGFVMQIRPERVADYLVAHEVVWPEMLAALRAAGWVNYSLFLRKEDGLVFGYVETDDFDAACARIESTDANARWQAHMSEYFVPTVDRMTRLTGYFHLG
ncbi:MAG: L-rhamnose mutarotase [Gordonia polyisoprenivorans]|nr:L-rhamnose mutarotase [Gordonia polyisoprenivorans]